MNQNLENKEAKNSKDKVTFLKVDVSLNWNYLTLKFALNEKLVERTSSPNI